MQEPGRKAENTKSKFSRWLIKKSFIHFPIGTIECFPGGSILHNIKFSRWPNIAQQKVFQVAHYCTSLEIRVLPTEAKTAFDLNVTALNAGAFYEPT